MVPGRSTYDILHNSRCICAHYTVVPAVASGVVLGPLATKFLDVDRWINKDQQAKATLGVMRLMIGIQL